MTIVELTEEAADWLEAQAWQISKHSEVGTLKSVAVAVDKDGLRIKINDLEWSPPHGDVVDRDITAEEETNWNNWR